MGPAENKRIAMRFYDEVVNAGDLSLIPELIADDFVDHEEIPGLPRNREGVRQWVEMTRSAFPDLTITVMKIVGEDDEIWVHSRMTGTHRGEFLGMPPTEKKVDVEAIDRVRVRDGKAIEHWAVTDLMGLMQQLGVADLPA